MLRDTGTKGLQNPVLKVFRTTIGVSVHALDETDNAFLDYLWRQTIGIGLERIRSCGFLRINRGKALVGCEGIWKNAGNEFFGVRVLQMNEVACAIEGKTILPERTAESADDGFLFEDNRLVFQQVVARAQTGEASADDDDLLHGRMSTFISRNADRPANDIVPPIVAIAHPNGTWLMRRAAAAEQCGDDVGRYSRFAHRELAAAETQREVIRAALRHGDAVRPSDPHHKGEVEKRNAEDKYRAYDCEQIRARIAGIHGKCRKHESYKQASCITEIDCSGMKIMSKKSKNRSA